MAFMYIYESLEVASQLEFKKISSEEAFHIFKTDDRFHLLDDTERYEDMIPSFYAVDHYKIYLGDIFVGLIAYKDMYNTWKDIPDNLTLFPQTKDGQGKESLWVDALEICSDASAKVGKGPFLLIRSIFDYLDVYCRNNGYKVIWCAAKDQRRVALYKRAGFMVLPGFQDKESSIMMVCFIK